MQVTTQFLIAFLLIVFFSCERKPGSEAHYVETKDSVKIMYVDLGNPENPPIIITHGGGDNSFGLRVFAQRLIDKYRVILYDERGTGLSTTHLPENKMKLENFIQDIYELQKALDIKSCYHIGHSFGGALVTEFALKYPEKVNKLILVNPLTDTRALWLDRANAADKYANQNKDTLALTAISKCKKGDSLTIEDEYQIVKEPRTIWFDFNEKKIDSMFRLLDYKSCGYNDTNIWADMELITAEKKAVDKYSNLKRIHRINCQTLIIGGTHDNAVTVRQCEIAHSIVPNSQIKIIQNCGHLSYIERPQELEKIIEDFLE